MEISDLPHGNILTLDVTPATPFGLERLPRLKQELTLIQVGELCALQLPSSPLPIFIEIRDSALHTELQRLLERNTPRLCWLVHARHSANLVQSLTIQIHEFTERISQLEIAIGVDDKLVRDLQSQLNRRVSLEAALEWLTAEFLIPGEEPGRPARFLVTGQPGVTGQMHGVFSILGPRHTLTVRNQSDGTRLALRLIRPKTARLPEEHLPIYLGEGLCQFLDQTIAAQVRQSATTEFDEIVRNGGGYLGMWMEYQSLEAKRILAEARQFGWLSYDGCRRLADGSWSFHLTIPWQPDQLAEQPDNDVSFEASPEIPEILLGAAPADDQWWKAQTPQQKQSRPGFRGFYAGAGSQSLLLRPPTSQDDPPPPPERGFIYLSLRGNLTIMDRRAKAHDRIVNFKTPIPQLRSLLENRSVPSGRVRAYEPLSPAAKAKFHSAGPTPRQVDAISVALNTPDIAVIQGPPGTGKTRTISAIIERVTEISEEQGEQFARVLLTSFQHDAVENAAAITQIFGLPAIKIGRGRGDSSRRLPLSDWMNKTATDLEAARASHPVKPLRRLLEDVRVRYAAYVQSPGTEAEAARMILDLEALTRAYIPAKLSDQMTAVADRLRLGTAGMEDAALEKIKAVRGLRVRAESFSDDGPKMAWRLRESLPADPLLTPADHTLLGQAIAWKTPSPLDFLPSLAELKKRLLDALLAAPPPSRVPLVNDAVLAVLDELLTCLDATVRNSVEEGPGLAVEQLIHDLRNDPKGAEDAVTRYTVVLAATCQQAVSKRMVETLSDDVEFDNVIVDEAARANPLDLLIPMSCASRRIILVGDHRQLPHLLEPEVERQLECSVHEETRRQIRRSLFERLFNHVKQLQEKDGIKRWVTLDTQYRMHPVLGTFVSDVFYRQAGEGFSSPPDAHLLPHLQHSLSGHYAGRVAAWKNLPNGIGAEEQIGHSWRRRCEAEWIARESHRLLRESPGLSLGVISFYTEQVKAIKLAMEQEGLMVRQEEDDSLTIAEAWRTTVNAHNETCERLRVGTVDAFQGKEFDIVILSVTRSNRLKPIDELGQRRKFGHLLLENRMCVAMSRQKRLLITVGDLAMSADEFACAVPALAAFRKLCQTGHGTII